MSRSKKISIFVLIVVIVLVCYRFLTKKTVAVAVQKQSVTEAVFGIGSLVPVKQYKLSLGLSATIKEYHVEAGATVLKGSKLVTIENVGAFYAPFPGQSPRSPFSQVKQHHHRHLY